MYGKRVISIGAMLACVALVGSGHAVAEQQHQSSSGSDTSMKSGQVQAPGDLQNADATTGAQSANKADKRHENLCEKCHVLRGQVLHSDHDSLLVKDASQKEVRLKLDKSTQLGQVSHPEAATFVEGDRIEAYVTEDGRAWSITTLKQQQSQPGVIGAPGD